MFQVGIGVGSEDPSPLGGVECNGLVGESAHRLESQAWEFGSVWCREPWKVLEVRQILVCCIWALLSLFSLFSPLVEGIRFRFR